MTNRYRALYTSEYFVLMEVRQPKTGKIYYEISMTGMFPSLEHKSIAEYLAEQQEFLEQVRDVIDPKRNKSGRLGNHWKFRTREEAEVVLTSLALRWT